MFEQFGAILVCHRADSERTDFLIPRGWLIQIAPWWVLCLVVGSFLPGSTKTALGISNPLSAIVEGRVAANHRFVHFVAFGSSALILTLIPETRAFRLVAALGVVTLGLAIEYGQYQFFDLIRMEWGDVRDDCLAVIVSLALAQWRGFRQTIVDDGR
jgi:hypothetical protein